MLPLNHTLTTTMHIELFEQNAELYNFLKQLQSSNQLAALTALIENDATLSNLCSDENNNDMDVMHLLAQCIEIQQTLEKTISQINQANHLKVIKDSYWQACGQVAPVIMFNAGGIIAAAIKLAILGAALPPAAIIACTVIIAVCSLLLAFGLALAAFTQNRAKKDYENLFDTAIKAEKCNPEDTPCSALNSAATNNSRYSFFDNQKERLEARITAMRVPADKDSLVEQTLTLQ